MKVGQVCIKISGRDAGKRGIILGMDNNKILIDGETRRRKVNIMHVIPTEKTVQIKQEATHEEVKKALAGIGITLKDKVKKQKKSESTEKQKPPTTKTTK
ncbi:50S ribosomal protein L14e [Candidatus Woesearchaeota archaeon]|nr:50S ribosomal protein L14e [Candidatus Woesearchaeota archaeon]